MDESKIMAKINQIEQKVGSVKSRIESLEKQRREIDQIDQANVQISSNQNLLETTMLQLDSDVSVEKKHKKDKKMKKKHHHKKPKRVEEDDESEMDDKVKV